MLVVLMIDPTMSNADMAATPNRSESTISHTVIQRAGHDGAKGCCEQSPQLNTYRQRKR
jgi:hypothetical protein